MLPILGAIAICYVVGQMFPGHEWLAASAVWSLGWLASLIVELALRSSRLGSKDIPRYPLNAHLFLGITMWPSFLLESGKEVFLRVAVALRFKPAWALPRPEDQSFLDLKLKNGRTVSVSVCGNSSSEPLNVRLDPGGLNAFVRAKMMAPQEMPPTEWAELEPMSQEEWSQEVEEAKDLKRPPSLVGTLTLRPGRYVLEFRVDQKNSSEEFSGLSVVLT